MRVKDVLEILKRFCKKLGKFCKYSMLTVFLILNGRGPQVITSILLFYREKRSLARVIDDFNWYL